MSHLLSNFLLTISVVNMDGGVGGSWEVKYNEQLPKSDSKPIDLT